MVSSPAVLADDAPHSGRIVDGVHVFPVRVHWEDTDAGGIVYHASYLRFMERGRSEMLRVLGLDQTEFLKVHGINYVVTRLEIDYRSPALFDMALQVCTSVEKVGHSRLDLTQTITSKERTLTEAYVRCAGVGSNGKPSAAPEAVRSLFKPMLKCDA